MKYVALALLFVAGCARAKISARDSLTPIMLGPVRALNGDLQDGNTAMLFRTTNSVTANAGLDGSSSNNRALTIPHALDFQLADPTLKHDDRIFAAAPVVCEQSTAYMLIAVSTTNDCMLRALRLFPASVPRDKRY